MIELTNENDPLLFCVTMPDDSRLVVQWNECLASIQKMNIEGEPSVEQISQALRSSARTKDIAARSSDESLFAVFARIVEALDKTGKT